MDTYQEVIPPEILKKFREYEYQIDYQGYRILNRWATNTPEKLAGLVSGPHGMMNLLMRVLKQQQIELDILTSLEGLAQRQNGLAPHEILQLFGVNMEL